MLTSVSWKWEVSSKLSASGADTCSESYWLLIKASMGRAKWLRVDWGMKSVTPEVSVVQCSVSDCRFISISVVPPSFHYSVNEQQNVYCSPPPMCFFSLETLARSLVNEKHSLLSERDGEWNKEMPAVTHWCPKTSWKTAKPSPNLFLKGDQRTSEISKARAGGLRTKCLCWDVWAGKKLFVKYV